MGRARTPRIAAWLLAVPLMVAGSQVAHTFAYHLVYPNARVRVHELIETGHGYLGYAPLAGGIGGALELIAFAWVVTRAVRGRADGRGVPPWAFALMPPLAFAVQEILERWLEAGAFPWWTFIQPTFAAGLMLQAPFALLAYLVARWLMRLAERAAPGLRGSLARPRLAFVLPILGRLPAPPAPESAYRDALRARGPPLLGY
jgi:hypothetical protein